MKIPHIFHGPYKALPLENAFSDIRRFMDEHPEEFFVFSLQCEDREKKKNLEQYNILFDLILKYFGDVAVTKSDSSQWFKVETVTIGEIQSHRRRVWILGDEYTCPSDNPPNKFIDQSETLNRHFISGDRMLQPQMINGNT